MSNGLSLEQMPRAKSRSLAVNSPIDFEAFSRLHAAFVLMFDENDLLGTCITISGEYVAIDVRLGEEDKLYTLLKIAGVREYQAGWSQLKGASGITYILCTIKCTVDASDRAKLEGISVPRLSR